jgi:predicted transcriptional regulator
VEKKSTRAIAVQLSDQTIKKLDKHAERSGMTRHRYMILILERAIEKEVILKETVQFTREL